MILDNKFHEAVGQLPETLRWQFVNEVSEQVTYVNEIRLTANNPPILLTDRGKLTLSSITSPSLLSDSVLSLTDGSLHTHQRELATGYLSLKGGHRAGVAGTAVYDINGQIKAVRNISAIVLRISHSFNLMTASLYTQLFGNGLCGVLVVGEPCSGKTTLLKNIASKLAKEYTVAVVDERGELCENLEGVCVLKGYNKAQGMMMAVRSLSPQVIICDEIGDIADVEAVVTALNCGVSVVTSIHARSKSELCRRKAGELLLNTRAFDKAVFLSKIPTIGTIREVVELDACM